MFLGACTIGEPLIILNEHMSGGENPEDPYTRPKPYTLNAKSCTHEHMPGGVNPENF